jgi:hypothetical protein
MRRLGSGKMEATMELDEGELSRRGALAIVALLSTGVLVSVGGLLVPSEVAAQTKKSAKPKTGKSQEKAEQGGEVSATEDLMREHGVLRRTLIVYGETARA